MRAYKRHSHNIKNTFFACLIDFSPDFFYHNNGSFFKGERAYMAHILVAEDDEMINELVVRNLEAVGHTCVQVYDGAAVLNAG